MAGGEILQTRREEHVQRSLGYAPFRRNKLIEADKARDCGHVGLAKQEARSSD